MKLPLQNRLYNHLRIHFNIESLPDENTSEMDHIVMDQIKVHFSDVCNFGPKEAMEVAQIMVEGHSEMLGNSRHSANILRRDVAQEAVLFLSENSWEPA